MWTLDCVTENDIIMRNVIDQTQRFQLPFSPVDKCEGGS